MCALYCILFSFPFGLLCYNHFMVFELHNNFVMADACLRIHFKIDKKNSDHLVVSQKYYKFS